MRLRLSPAPHGVTTILPCICGCRSRYFATSKVCTSWAKVTSADVYLERPFGVGELMARQRVPLRRSSKAGGINPAVRWIMVDLDKRLITRNVKPVNLTPEAYRQL
jgi:hypothetical protein